MRRSENDKLPKLALPAGFFQSNSNSIVVNRVSSLAKTSRFHGEPVLFSLNLTAIGSTVHSRGTWISRVLRHPLSAEMR